MLIGRFLDLSLRVAIEQTTLLNNQNSKCPYLKNPISGLGGTDQMKSHWNQMILKANQMNPWEKSQLPKMKNS